MSVHYLQEQYAWYCLQLHACMQSHIAIIMYKILMSMMKDYYITDIVTNCIYKSYYNKYLLL